MKTTVNVKIKIIYMCVADEYNTTYKWVRLINQEYYFPLGYQWDLSEKIGEDSK